MRKDYALYMIRIHVFLTKEQVANIKKSAVRTGIKKGEYLRRIIDKFYSVID